jgi:predicted phosphodiesterase
MILGFVSAAHGNPVGLSRCLRVLEAAKIDRLYFLGDAVGYLPDENPVMELLEDSSAIAIRGNHEEMLLGRLDVSEAREKVYRIEDARRRLDPRFRRSIEGWPLDRAVTEDGRRIFMVHGSRSDPVGGYVYPDTDLSPFAALPYHVLFLGQTHRPFVRSAGPVTVVNVGSSGMPRDVGDLASCATFDTRTGEVAILRVRWDAEALAGRLEGAVDPSVTALLRRPPKDAIVGRIVDLDPPEA